MTKKYIAIILSLAFFCIESAEYKKKKIPSRTRNLVVLRGTICSGLAAGCVALVGLLFKSTGDSILPSRRTNVANFYQIQIPQVQKSQRFYSVAHIINTYGIPLAGLGVGLLAIKALYQNCFEVQYNCAVDCINKIKKHPQLKNNLKMRKKMIGAYNALYSFSKKPLLSNQYRLEAIVILRDLKKLIVLPSVT